MATTRNPASLGRDVALTLPTRVGVLALGVVTSAVIARSLGPTGRGVVATAYSLSTLLMQVGILGLTRANPYFAAREPEVRRRIVANSLVLAFGLGAVLGAVAWMFWLAVPGALPGINGEELALALAGVPVALASAFLRSQLLGEGRMVPYNAIELIVTAATLAVLVVALVALDGGVVAALAVLVGGRAVSAAAYGIALATDGLERPDRSLLRRMLPFGLRVYATTVIAYLVVRIDILLVNGYGGPRQAGLYACAVALADAVGLVPAVIAMNLFAHVARGADDAQTVRVLRLLAAGYAVLVLAVAMAAEPILRLVYGDAFTGATHLVWWLAPGVWCLGMATVLTQHYTGRGLPARALSIWTAGLVVNVAINIAFLHDGTYVAALASSIAYALVFVLLLRMFTRNRAVR